MMPVSTYLDHVLNLLLFDTYALVELLLQLVHISLARLAASTLQP